MVPVITQLTNFVLDQPEIRNHSAGIYLTHNPDRQLIVVTMETLATLALTDEVGCRELDAADPN
jgi:hypothetical protein